MKFRRKLGPYADSARSRFRKPNPARRWLDRWRIGADSGLHQIPITVACCLRPQRSEILQGHQEIAVHKIVVPLKRVLDHNLKVRILPDAQGLDLAGQKMAMNPFDEVALEEAIRLRERGLSCEVVAVSCGVVDAHDVLRQALALGADRAVLLESKAVLQPLAIARVLKAFVEREAASLVLCGKQAIDDDSAQVGPMLAAMLGWPQACFATEISVADGHAHVTSAIDGGEEVLQLQLPAVITAELHLNTPRFASLLNVMKARRAAIETVAAESLALDLVPRLEVLGYQMPPPRPAGNRLHATDALIRELAERGFLQRGSA